MGDELTLVHREAWNVLGLLGALAALLALAGCCFAGRFLARGFLLGHESISPKCGGAELGVPWTPRSRHHQSHRHGARIPCQHFSDAARSRGAPGRVCARAASRSSASMMHRSAPREVLARRACDTRRSALREMRACDVTP